MESTKAPPNAGPFKLIIHANRIALSTSILDGPLFEFHSLEFVAKSSKKKRRFNKKKQNRREKGEKTNGIEENSKTVVEAKTCLLNFWVTVSVGEKWFNFHKR